MGEERAAADQRLADQCLQLADQHPGSQGALAALYLAASRAPNLVVSFWATWCRPCMKLIPHGRELATRLADKPFAIVGINGDTDEKAIQEALDKHKVTWQSFRDNRPGKDSISEEWNAFYPTVFLIDHKGIFRKRWTGEPPIDVLNRMVDELVAEAMDKDTN